MTAFTALVCSCQCSRPLLSPSTASLSTRSSGNVCSHQLLGRAQARLIRDGGKGDSLILHWEALLGFHCLMQPLTPPAAQQLPSEPPAAQHGSERLGKVHSSGPYHLSGIHLNGAAPMTHIWRPDHQQASCHLNLWLSFMSHSEVQLWPGLALPVRTQTVCLCSLSILTSCPAWSCQ